MQAWHRSTFGLVHLVDTDPQLSGAIPDLISNASAVEATDEANYQTRKTALTGAHANLTMVVSGPRRALTGSNPGHSEH